MLRTAIFANALLFVVAIVTYPGLFVINPFVAGLTVMSLFQALSIVGLLMSIALPFWIREGRSSSLSIRILFFVSVLLWPFSILSIRLLLFIGSGDWGFSYLINFPIFAFTDYVLPIVAIVLYLKSSRKDQNQSRILAGRDSWHEDRRSQNADLPT